MIEAAPHVWVPRFDPLWYPGNQRGYSLDEVAGRILEPSEYAPMRRQLDADDHGKREIRRATIRAGKSGFSGARFRSGIAPGAFSPSDVGTLAFWLDMQDVLAFTNSSGFVSQILNKKSAVAWTEATDRPTYVATGLNGFHCMDLDNVNDKIDSTESAVVTALSQNQFTILHVAKHDIVDRNDAVFGFGRADTPNSRGYWGTSTTGAGSWAFTRINSAGVNTNRSSTATSDIDAHVSEWWDDGTLTHFMLDGTLDSEAPHTSVYGTVAPTHVTVGATMNTGAFGDFMDGRIGEILFYRGALSVAARGLARHYLGDKWTITVV
jgi:hypothetical protein